MIVAGAAASLQAAATLGAFAWLSRTLPVAEVGRFGLYLAILSFVLALDGIRQGVVVSSTTGSSNQNDQVTHLAAIALVFGLFVAAAIVLAGRLMLGLQWIEIIPLAVTAFLLLVTSPGLGRLEAAGGPHWAAALHSIAWATALSIAAFLASRAQSAPVAAWAMMVAPATIFTVLGFRGMLVLPSFQPQAPARRIASQGLRSHAVTAIAGFLDKAVLAVHAGPQALGLYTPLAELTGRASALGGLVSNLFLRDEALSALSERKGHARRNAHGSLVDAVFGLACLGITLTALVAWQVLEAFVARSSADEVTAFRVLLACLALNLGAQWSAVTLRARGEFDLYRPYVASLIAAGLLAHWLVSTFGITGGALVVLVLRTADVALMFRARALLTTLQLGAVATTATISLSISAIGQLHG